MPLCRQFVFVGEKIERRGAFCLQFQKIGNCGPANSKGKKTKKRKNKNFEALVSVWSWKLGLARMGKSWRGHFWMGRSLIVLIAVTVFFGPSKLHPSVRAAPWTTWGDPALGNEFLLQLLSKLWYNTFTGGSKLWDGIFLEVLRKIQIYIIFNWKCEPKIALVFCINFLSKPYGSYFSPRF